MHQNIPVEMQERAQWVAAGLDKQPINPLNGQPASVTNPKTWGTFQQAKETGLPHIGFVLTDDDPYTIIDLDYPQNEEQRQRHLKVLEMFQSYTEISASGTGFHIIVKGRVPRGIRRDKIEVYSNQRYMICTGNLYTSAPIENRQELLDVLFTEMTSGEAVSDQWFDDNYAPGDATMDDAELVEMASNAANGDKFDALCRGEWEELGYPSASEADLALVNILCYYTRDDDQVKRIFSMTLLGKRKDYKALHPTRWKHTLRRARVAQPPPVDMSQLEKRVKQLRQKGFGPKIKHEKVAPPVGRSNTPDIFPPGLVGELANYFYTSAIRPVPEIALCAAIALTAGVAGRSYNVSGTGLNQYLILLAGTGSGKESAASGIDSLLAATRPIVPSIDTFIGPATFASGQALIRSLDEQPCFMSLMGEFGLTLQQLCDPRAQGATVMLKKVLLDLYNKSGWRSVLRSSVYSDTDKNTKVIQAPCVTIFGEGTPSTFYDGLDIQHVAEGLIPRFSIVEYEGGRPPRNVNAFHAPPEPLVKRFADLAAIALSTQQNSTCAPVTLSPQAKELTDDFDKFADAQINQRLSEVSAQLWNRAHLKVLKLSALLAVGISPHNPVINRPEAEWAVGFVREEIEAVVHRFQIEAVGRGHGRQEDDLRRAIEGYFELDNERKRAYKVPEKLLDQPFVPYSYLRRRLRRCGSFTEDRLGFTRALKVLLQDLVDADVLVEMSEMEMRTKFGLRSPCFGPGEAW